MRIQSISAYSPHFKGLLLDKDAYNTFLKNTQTSDEFARAFQKAGRFSKDVNVVVEKYGNDGLSIREVEDLKTKKTVEILAENDNALTALKKAANILKERFAPKKEDIMARHPSITKYDHLED